MKPRITCILALIFCASAICVAQNRPLWIISVENTIKQKEKFWKIQRGPEHYFEDGSYSYSFTLKFGGDIASIEIGKINKIPNGEETFVGQATVFDKTMGRNKKKTKLENFGDEGFLWVNSIKGDWTVIMFRKNDIFVRVFASSEKLVKRFAQYVKEQIPDK